MSFNVADNYSEYDCELFDESSLEGDSCYLNVECYCPYVDDDDMMVPEQFNPFSVDVVLA